MRPAPGRPGAGRSSSRAQQEVWKLEQQVVASLIQVDPDPPVDNSVIGQNPLFHLVRDDHHDIYSFSSTPELYGGVDVSFPDDETKEDAVAVYVVVDKRTMGIVYADHVFFKLTVPYIPTFLAFREIQPLESLVKRQMQLAPEWTPNSILVDGNGIFHPCHAGIACFLGIRTGLPTIGIGKTLLYEGGWTREAISHELNQLLMQVHSTIRQNPIPLAHQLSRYRGLIVKRDVCKPINESDNIPSTTSSARHASDRSGRNLRRMSIDIAAEDDDADEAVSKSGDDLSRTDEVDYNNDIHNNNSKPDRVQILQDLAPFCNGLALQLAGAPVDNGNSRPTNVTKPAENRPYFPILGCALVGHGGQIASSSKSQPVGGTRNPIYISVGHKMSLQRAVQICASLSMTRIPEPVRQADLMGRDLIRQLQARAESVAVGTIDGTGVKVDMKDA